MSKNLRVFEYIDEREDRSLNWSGWRMIGQEHFDPCTTGMTIVHDCIEHFKKNDSGLVAEALAFGAIIHIRSNGGWWNGTHWKDKAIDMLQKEFLDFMMQENFQIDDCDEPLAPEIESEVLSRLQFAKYCSNGNQWHADEYEEQDKDLIYSKYISALRWMSVGLKKAKLRWSAWDSYTLSSFFRNMMHSIDSGRIFNDAYHGDRLEVRFDTKTLDYSIRWKTWGEWITIQ